MRLPAWIALAAFAAVTGLSGGTRAEDRKPGHDGLLLRLAIGLGGAASGEEGYPEIQLAGPAGFFSIDLGGTLSRGAALHVRLSSHAVVDPTLWIDGEEVGELRDTSVTFVLLGVGVTHYFASNLYLTGVIGAAGVTLEVQGTELESETGIGVVGDIGYEWAIGGDWGLGLGGRLEFYSIPDGDYTLAAAALGLLLTATYH